MMGLFRHTTGWLAFFLAINVSSVLAQTCRLPPPWSINGISPMGQARGSVMVVALLQASCPLCLWQATGLENIKQQLAKQNVNDIRFIIINSNLQHSIDNVGELARRVTFPVYQDTHSTNIWDLLNGGKDDVLIYDRCGLLTYHIPYPRSLLNERHFQNAFLDTYLKNPCGCHSSYNPEPVQRGLAPSQQSNRQTTQLVRQQPGGQRQRPADRSHSRQHQQQRNRRVKRNLHSFSNRLSDVFQLPIKSEEIRTNRISKCFNDTLCSILQENEIKYSRKHAKMVSNLLLHRCQQCPSTSKQCLCPRDNAIEKKKCTCSDGTVRFNQTLHSHQVLDVSFCLCSQASQHNKEYINSCFCEACEAANTAPRHVTTTDRTS